ncbi:MAG TPA: hypothetical protein VLT90_01810 [Terriglobales bacterium]|nr:hypothetical protein [Terriglobales bacterium]
MRGGCTLQNDRTAEFRCQRGYILITLMLFFTLLAIAALAALPEITQQLKRDREEELIHRGVQYTRAVQRYYKKFGRYPTRIEELESTNNLRFLRKRYKDPVTGKDFRLLRLGDPALVGMGFGQGFGQGIQAVAQALQQGNRPGFVAAPGGGVRPAGPGDTALPQVTGLPGSASTVQQAPESGETESSGGAADTKSDESGSSSSGSSPGLGGQVFGGGPIVGVASTSNAKTIREFNNKSHYKEWPFVYDPSSDRGGLLNTPTQPNLTQSFNAAGQPAGGQGQAQQTPQTGQAPSSPPQQNPSPDEQ